MGKIDFLQSDKVKAEAMRLGFSACGLAEAAPVAEERAAAIRQWLAKGCHADMDYLARNLDKRLDPRLLVDGARTVVSLAVNYYTADGLSPHGYCFARYALGRDYHDVVKEMLRRLMHALGLDEPLDGRPFVDTAPIDERYWAMQAGLGWQGRSGQLIIPHAGTYFFLGELVLTLPADRYDSSLAGRCGTCHRCVDACPAHALPGDGTVDARRCLSYLTIENRWELPPGTGKRMGGCVYGCDRCSEVCPWNRFARPTAIDAFRPSEALRSMTADAWRNLTVEDYRLLFKGSAVKRAKYGGLVRNIAALNGEDGDKPESPAEDKGLM